MCNCNKYHLSGVPKGSINLTDALNNGYLIAALVSMGFNFKDTAQYNQMNSDVLMLGRSAQMVFGAQIRAIAQNINVLTAQFQVMNQALKLNETNPYILTAAQLKKSFIDAGLNINKKEDRVTWLTSYAPTNASLQYIEMEPTRKILDSIPIQMSVQPDSSTTQQPGPAGHEVAQNPLAKTEMGILGKALLVGGLYLGGLWLYNKFGGGSKSHSKSRFEGIAGTKKKKVKAVKSKSVQTITF